MKYRKSTALFLAAVMMLSIFSACGTADDGQTSGDTAQQDIAGDTVVASVAGADITWGQVCYWMYYQMSEYYNQYSTTPNLSVELSEGYTYGDHMLDTAIDKMVRYRVIESYAKENGIELVTADKAGVDENIKNMVERYGSQEAYEQSLARMNATADDMRTIQELSFLSQRVYKTLYGPEGDKLSEEALADYAETNGYVMAKLILFLKIDDTGAALDAAALEKAKTAADETAAELESWSAAGSSYATLEDCFTALMSDKSEDASLEYFKNGYIIGPDDMQAEIYDAVSDLGEGEISGVIDTASCYALVMRVPMDYDATPYSYKSYATYGYNYSFRQLAASALFDTQVQGWVDSADVEKKPILAEINTADYFSR